MKIIGHRGAAGLLLENTMESIQAAVDAGVDLVEFDVRVTKDNHYVICHDDHLGRVSDSNQLISKLTFKQLQKIALLNGEYMPLLSDVLKILDKTPAIVEIKVRGHTEGICRVLDQFPNHNLTVATFLPDVAKECKQLRPELPVFVAEHRHPIEAIRYAKQIGADGLDINYSLLNPITYYMARRAGLQVMVYTVNHAAIVHFIRWFYPHVWVCTNYPHKYIGLGKRKEPHERHLRSH